MDWATIGSSIVSGAEAADSWFGDTPPATATNTGPIARPIVYKNTGETEGLFGGGLDSMAVPLALIGLLIFGFTQL